MTELWNWGANPEYTMYESPPYVEQLWHDDSAIGLCGQCGMDDATIVMHDWTSASWCKFCRELFGVNRHLETNKKAQVNFELVDKLNVAMLVLLLLVSLYPIPIWRWW